METYIIQQCIGFGHQSRYSRGMHDFAMIAGETGPERAEMQLKLIKPQCARGLEKRIQVILEPSPDFSSGDTLRGRTSVAESLFNLGERRQVSDRVCWLTKLLWRNGLLRREWTLLAYRGWSGYLHAGELGLCASSSNRSRLHSRV